MIGNQKVIALITARGGSKRLPGKNIKPLAGKPLIGFTIEFARSQPEIDRIVVSTDSPEIAEVARNFGADVPWLRPAELSGDTTSSADVVKHALAELARSEDMFDYLVLLQPTTPFRDPAMLTEALNLCRRAGGAPVIAFGAAKSHPCWCFRQTADGRLVRYVEPDLAVTRSQDLPAAFEVSGSLYVIGVERFLKDESFIAPDLQGVFSNHRRYDCDIDDEIDWLVAEAMLAHTPGISR